jgi:hypothetical protein
MNIFFETLSVIALVATALALTFIFEGEPDLWDKWHEQAMIEANK